MCGSRAAYVAREPWWRSGSRDRRAEPAEALLELLDEVLELAGHDSSRCQLYAGLVYIKAVLVR